MISPAAGEGKGREGRRGEGKRSAPQARMRAEVRWGKEKKGGEEGGKRERKREGKGGGKERASGASEASEQRERSERMGEGKMCSHCFTATKH